MGIVSRGAHHGSSGRATTALAILLVLLLVATSCSSGGDETLDGPENTPAPDGAPTDDDIEVVAQQAAAPRSLRLSQGQAAESSENAESVDLVQGEALTDDEVAQIIGRLPEWTDDPEDQQDFNRPPESLPPPRTGETIESTFPESFETDVPTPVPAGPLEVLRYQPEGAVDIAPTVSITFNQPMVPLATLDQLDERAVPATMTPDLPGRWEWIGTRTLRFEHESEVIDRLPMATAYTVEVPAGTTSETGGELTETVQFEFLTPTVQVERFAPTSDFGGTDLEPIFVAHFDQRVDTQAVLETIALEAAGSERQIRLATDEEIGADDRARREVGQATENRYVAFRATKAFQPNTAITIRIGPNVPSAEGPLTSDRAETFSAHTYEPLAVSWHNCKESDECQPLSPLSMEFNNALDLDAFDPTTIIIEPELPGAVINATGTGIFIQGPTSGRTDYKVTLPSTLTDVWGQTLTEEKTLTFEIGEAWPTLVPLSRDLITTDPYADKPTVSVSSINHDELRVLAFAVEPQDWRSFIDSRWKLDDEDFELPSWDKVLDEKVDVDANDDELAETAIDLSGALDGDHGQLVVLVMPEPQYRTTDDQYWANRPTMAWVQVTDIGVDAFADNERMVAWTTDLANGALIEGVEVELVGAGTTLVTGPDGLATTELTSRRSDLLTATKGDDLAILPNWSVERETRTDVLRWYVIDDRSMYRPGETVSVKGWVRNLTLSSDAQLAPVPDNASVTYSVFGPQGNELDAGTADVNTLGGFDLTVDIPANANLGMAYIEMDFNGGSSGGQRYSHGFQIQEFRRPEFEVAARNESPGPYFQTEPATVAVDAIYFSGGPLPNAEVEWRVTTSDSSYTPPNWGDFTFGIWTPWWYDPYFGGYDDQLYEEEVYVDDYSFEEPPFPGGNETQVEVFSGVTDAGGTHYLQIDFLGDETDQPASVNAAATVFDVNRQAWGSSTSMLVHPSDLYVGLRSDRTFVRKGDPMVISTIVTDIDGNAVPDRALTVDANLLEWRIVKGEWQEVVVDTKTCEVTTASEPVTCTFETDAGGEYQITSTVVDDQERRNRSELTFWVSGGKQRPNRTLEQEELTLIPDKADYEPGDEAELLVQAPFESGEGLLTVARNGIESNERFEVVEGTAVLKVAITDHHIPNVHVQVDVVGAADRVADDGSPLPDAPPRPAFATAQLSLSVPPTSRTLTVDAVPESEFAVPGGDTSVAVTVTNAAGEPVADAELAVIVVDEAVLALSNYQLTDPVGTFYSPIPSELRSQYLRHSVVLENPMLLLGDAAGRLATSAAVEESAEEFDDAGGDFETDAAADFAAEAPTAEGEAGGNSAQPAIDVRTNFDALAVFEPEVRTDAKGEAVIAVPLPDNLTRYRVMVIAVDGADEFGSAESNITARLPLQVRPSAPRFLNFGDEFEFPVVLQNQSDEAMEVDVIIQASNMEITDYQGTRVNVPANDRIEVRFSAAADEAGTARYRVAAVSSDLADAASDSLPVHTPATAEGFATYGVVDSQDTVIQPVLAPTDVWPQFGGLEINTSSTALQALTDAVIYINEYPYSSADAHGSRILAISALRDVLEAFDAEDMPTPAELNATVQADLDAIEALQNGDGGFPIWRRWDQSWSYHSVHVTHALVEAKNNGYDVPGNTLERALDYLRFIEDHYYPTPMSQKAKDTISAYALYVRHLNGETDTAKAEDLYRRRGPDLALEAIAWLWPLIDDPTMDAEIERTFLNRATDTAGAATFTTDYGDDAYVLLHSDRRTDGVILDAFISERPDSDLIPKVVAGLLGHRTKGRWDNMQENTFILLALNNYFDTFEAEDPDFVAQVWLGDIYAAEHEYRGRSTDRNETVVPMAELIDQGDSDLVVRKNGEAGRLYYRLGLRYAPSELKLEPRDRGFVVSRTFEAVDEPDDVSLDGDGVWHIKAGAEVRVRVTMVADSRRTHVALIDPLPAGLEVLNPALAATPEIAPDPNAPWNTYWYWQWFGHQNLRDDRAEAFTTLLSAGIYEYSYVARATTPGRFVTPPARAEEMYAPETFGRSATDFVIVE